MAYKLTEGSVKVLYDDQKDSPIYNNPTLQVINIKSVAVTGGNRYRLILSDGIHFMQGMLATTLSTLAEEETIKRNSIIVLKESVCNMLQNRKILIIMKIDVVATDVEGKIGSPATLENTTSSIAVATKPEPVMVKPASSGFSGASGANMQLEASLTPIKNLNPYQTRWTIKARITQKSPIKKWHNARGDGQLFSVNLLDQSGEIKATAFNDQVDRLFHVLEEGKVYYISKARVTMAKKQFSTLNNEYELGLEHATEIEACGGESNIPQMNFDVIKIADIEKHEKGSIIDIAAVVTEDAGMSEIVSKASGKPAKKRELTVVDDSMKSIRLTLWDTCAEEFDASGSPVVFCKGVRVGDFNGRTLSLGGSGSIKRNPDLPAAQRLQKWYLEIGANSSFDAYSNVGSMSSGGDTTRTNQKINLQQVKTENLGSSDKPDYFRFKGTVVFIKSETFAYPGCPECNKKVTMEENGWRCEKCQKRYDNPNYRYMLTASVEDAFSQLYLNGFDDFGKTLLNMDANELTKVKEEDAQAGQQIFNKALFRTFNITARAKQETFQDVARTKYQVVDISPINFVAEGNDLVSSIERVLAN